eukprot:gb/GECH01009709.1/.p1 GENE.gb/GECH01009709.1/~~gb/GECH01009709.1/.p1  ORF type:complete len:420 (+),score=64.79 gb/GECH01009709.1/:1-1260(+)
MAWDIPGFVYDPQRNRYFPASVTHPSSSPSPSPSTPSSLSSSSSPLSNATVTEDFPPLRKSPVSCFSLIDQRRHYTSLSPHRYHQLHTAVVMRHLWRGHAIHRHTPSRVLAATQDGRLVSSSGRHVSVSSLRHTDPHPVTLHTWNTPSPLSRIVIMPRKLSTSHDTIDIPSFLEARFGGAGQSGAVVLRGGSTDWEEGGEDGTMVFSAMKSSVWDCDVHGTGLSPRIAVGASRAAYVVDTERRRSLRRLKMGRTDVTACCFDSSGHLLLCGARNGQLTAFDVRQPRPVRLCHTAGLVRGIHLVGSGGDTRAVVAAAPSDLRLWDLVSGRTVVRYGGHRSKVGSDIGMTGDRHGRYVMVSGSDPTVSIWDIRLANPIHRFEGYRTAVSSLSSPEDGVLYCGGTDDTVYLYTSTKRVTDML